MVNSAHSSRQRENASGSLVNTEREPFPHYPILITGAGHGTGLQVARRLAREGHTILIGTRTPESFEAARQTIVSANGVEPRPFVADFTKPDEILTAYKEAGIQTGDPLHYFPFAAAGFEALLLKLARPLAPILKAAKTGQIPQNLSLSEITEKIRQIVKLEESMKRANRVNRDAAAELGNLLLQNGNLGEGSRIATLSSNISDYADPENPDGFPGPWFYFPVGMSKAEGVQRMMLLAQSSGAHYIDFVASEITGTDMSELFKNVMFVLQQLVPDGKLKIPHASMEEVAEAIFTELTRPGMLAQIRKAYILESGRIAYERPDNWVIPVMPFL